MKKYISSSFWFVFFSILCALFASLITIGSQFLKGMLLDSVLDKNQNAAIYFGLILTLTVLLEILFYYGFDIYRSKFSTRIAFALRRDFVSSVFSKSFPVFSNKQSGEYISEFTNTIRLINDSYVAVIPLLIEVIIKSLFVTISLFILDYRIALITVILLTAPLYVPKLIEKRLQSLQKAELDSLERMVTLVTGWFRGFELIKNYSLEKIIRDKFGQSNNQTMCAAFSFRKLAALSRSISTLLSYISHLIILFIAAYFVLIGKFSAGTFFIAISLIDQLSYPILSTSEFIKELLSTKGIAKELVLLTESQEARKGVPIERNLVKNVNFVDVGFSFEKGRTLLNKFNLEAHLGDHCLLRGKNGSGKTTAMNLLLDYYQPQFGKILINDIPVSQISNLYEIISIQRQDNVFFQDTLFNNLTLYQPITKETVISGLDSLGLYNYCNEVALEQMVAENGANFSGGEKRRFTLLREILQDKPILILDEPFANIDKESIIKIEEMINDQSERIIFLISHQPIEGELRIDKQVFL